ncbi:hypothetical protein Back11_32150 [Paenibacillus baekrokdamisoli]|uniref:Uncharacterized protein n=1 Tax=Paenibacillus baekrokdamisoli TaxID=1712516 RepID=A0A3G9ISP2_9BACL|nr:hypothetical protein [Paenibacillus baekrokdamisoli]MBB3071620.1 hypothetical protein [Paenibacillus baekrokdamisoli]BBH21870.1 hypothetical protein Back11_32150 [Paenibacillus baekrokdamisoli]
MKKGSNKVASIVLGSALLMSLGGPAFAETPNNSTISQEVNYSKEERDKAIVDQLKKEMQAAQSNFPAQNQRLQSLHQPKVEPLIAINSSGEVDLLRATWGDAAITLRIAGLPMTCDFLIFSLDDHPVDLSYPANSNYSNKVHAAPAMNTFITDFKKRLPSTGSFYSESTSLALNSPTDIYLSLHNVQVLTAAEKVNGVWTIYTRVYDLYNFEYWNYDAAHSVPAKFVTLVNNSAVRSQEIGAIVPYNVTFFMQDTK